MTRSTAAGGLEKIAAENSAAQSPGRIALTESKYIVQPIGRVESPLADRMLVRNMEALSGTPILDVKPVLGPAAER